MAFTSTNTHHVAPALHALATSLRAFGRFLITLSEANSQTQQVAYLQSLSDSELAARGLTRENIVEHVFCSHFYL